MAKTLLHGMLALLLLLNACAAPLTIERTSLDESYRRLNRTTLSGDEPSEPTLTVLRTRALMNDWQADPDAAIETLRRAVVTDPAAWQDLFALAELYYLQGKREQSRKNFLSAAIFAYAFLLPGGDAPRPSAYEPRFRQAADLYNLGLTAAFSGTDDVPIPLVSQRRPLPFGTIDLYLDEQQLRWGGRTLISFEPTATLRVEGVQNIFRTPGLGAPLAAMTRSDPAADEQFKIAPRLRVPTNMLMVLDAPRRQLTGGTLTATLMIHTIFDQFTARVGGETIPLEYDQTAARALSLVEAGAWSNEFWDFLNGSALTRRQSQLVALQPHRPGRMPVILIHGTASSPFRWFDMTNDLLEDPRIRDNFEFWFFSYGTGNPVAYSALQLRRAIQDAVKQLGGTQADPALGRITLIGHSQGGLLAKMLVVDPGDRLWDAVSPRPIEALKMQPNTRAFISAALFPEPMPEVQRVIFIATPHRGSFLAGLSVSAWLARLVTLPLDFTKAVGDVLAGNADQLGLARRQMRFGSIHNMSPNSPFIQALATTPIAPGVHAHSIIPVRTRGPAEQGNDGVVRFDSAHLDGVDSELIVQSGHSTQGNPMTIAEVRRILLLQLATNTPAAPRPMAQIPAAPRPMAQIPTR